MNLTATTPEEEDLYSKASLVFEPTLSVCIAVAGSVANSASLNFFLR